MKGKIVEQLDLFEEAFENSKRMVNRYLPLHKQMKNLYKQNRTLKTKDRLRKEQIEKRNLDLLAQVAVEQFGNIQDTTCFCFCEVNSKFWIKLGEILQHKQLKQRFCNKFCCETTQT
jgi:hypothetical protein